MNRGPCIVLVAATLFLTLASAHAGPCTEAIAQFETTLREAASDPNIGPSAPQSIGAQLEHQPTPESVRTAERRARAGFEDALARAKHFDAMNQRAECTAALTEARLIYFQ